MKRYGWVFAAVCFPILFGMNYVPVNALPILCAAAFAVALALFFLRKRIRIVPAALCGAAAFVAVLCYTVASYVYQVPAQALDGKTVEARVQVVEEPEDARHVVRVVRAELDGEPVRVPGKLVCYIYDEPLQAFDTFDATLALRLPGTGSQIRRERADGVFLYADVETRGEANRPDRLPVQSAVLAVRSHMRTAITETVGGEEGAFAAALLTGDTSGLGETVVDGARATGLSHILAVSGLHLSILNGFLLVLFGKLRMNKWAANIVCILFTLGFMAVAAFTPSVLRAGIMSIILFIGRLAGREPDTLNSLGIAVTLICVVNPFAAVSVSLILSALATLGIVVFSPALMDFINARFKIPAYLHWAVDTAVVTVSAVLFTLPASVVYFSEVSVLSVPANLLVSIPSSIILVCGLLLSVCAFVPGLNLVVAFPVKVLGAFVLGVIEWLASLPLTTVYLKRGPTLVWLGFTGVLLAGYFIFRRRAKPSKRYLAALCASVLLVSVMAGMFSGRERLRLTFLDVGQADCSVARLDGGTVVIDCGLDSSNTVRTLVSSLKEQGVYSIDTLVVSHYHDDHAGGVASLLRSMPVGELFIPEATDQVTVKREILNAARDRGVTVYEVGGEMEISVGALRLELYASHMSLADVDENERCLVVNLSYGDFNCLFMGDAGFQTEDYLVWKYGGLLEAEVLKAGHHGSNTSSGYAFLNRVRPQLIVVPMRAGARLPGTEGLARLQSTGAPVYQTGIYGPVKITVLPDGGFYVEEEH